jgi:hypothetical protein
MTVVRLPQPQDPQASTWRASELRHLEAIFAAYACRGEASEWAVGCTDFGAPQFYLLGPAADRDCVLCITRVGRLYVLEDGRGNLLSEDARLQTLAAKATRAAARRGGVFVLLGLVSTWYALRRTLEQKLEPILVEPVEMLSHIAPQLATLA